jgi:hypothetical protein
MILEVAQIGATVRRALDEQPKQSSGRNRSRSRTTTVKERNPFGNASLDVIRGIIDKTPVISEITNLTDAAGNGNNANRLIASYVSSFIVPQLLKEYAKGKDNVKRDPQSLADEGKMFIPGLRQTVRPKKEKDEGRGRGRR